MPEPSPEKKSFFENHLQELSVLIERTNCKRASKRLPALTEEEIDTALDDLIYSKDPKADIASYQFKEPQDKTPQIKTQETTKAIQIDKISFEIIKCSNGYMMTMKGSSLSETFIFKSLEELSEIFAQVLFLEDSRKVRNGKSKSVS